MQPGEPSDKNQGGLVLKGDLGWQWSPAEEETGAMGNRRGLFRTLMKWNRLWKQGVQKGGMLPETEVVIKNQAGCK